MRGAVPARAVADLDEMDFPEEMRNFIEIPPALRPPAPANEALRLNPSGRPVLAEVEARAVPVRNATQPPAAPVPAPLCVYACAAPASLCAETLAARGGVWLRCKRSSRFRRGLPRSGARRSRRRRTDWWPPLAALPSRGRSCASAGAPRRGCSLK